MISCPAANGIRCVKPARYAVSPSWMNFEIASFIVMSFWESIDSRSLCRNKLEPVADHAFLGVDPPEFGGDGHPDPHVLRAHVRHLPDDFRALLKLHDRHRIRPAGFLLLRELRRRAARADEGERVDLASAAELDLLEVGRAVTIFADAFRREVHLAAFPARVPDEAVPLRDRAPVHRDGDVGHPRSPHLIAPLIFRYWT